MRHFNSIVLLCLPLLATAQAQDFSNDMPFFQSKAALYQRWLDTFGLSPLLRVEEVRFQPNRKTKTANTSELELLLKLRSPDPDTAAAQWRSLSDGYAATTGRSLKTDLFRHFVYTMEIPAAQGNVQVYPRLSAGKRSPCFFVWVWEEKGTLRDSLLRDGCRAQTFEVPIPTVAIRKTGRNGKPADVRKNMGVDEVFEHVMQFVRQKYPYDKYKNSNCSGRHPAVVDSTRRGNELTFTLTELCREALSQGSLSIWCHMARAVGWQKDCNDIRRERLEFTIQYIAKDAGTFALSCHLRGKFGSSDYVPRSGDYFDMDPDFIQFEQEFADNFKRELAEYLKKRP